MHHNNNLPLAGTVLKETPVTAIRLAVRGLHVTADPSNVEVYMFSAKEVRERFDAAYAARIKAGNVVKDNFGMWVALDLDQRGIAASVGSGLASVHKPIAVYPLDELMTLSHAEEDLEAGQLIDEGRSEAEENQEPHTIAEVMDWARGRLAKIAGVPRDAVKLDLKIET